MKMFATNYRRILRNATISTQLPQYPTNCRNIQPTAALSTLVPYHPIDFDGDVCYQLPP